MRIGIEKNCSTREATTDSYGATRWNKAQQPKAPPKKGSQNNSPTN